MEESVAILQWSLILKFVTEHNLHQKLLLLALCSKVMYTSAKFARSHLQITVDDNPFLVYRKPVGFDQTIHFMIVLY